MRCLCISTMVIFLSISFILSQTQKIVQATVAEVHSLDTVILIASSSADMVGENGEIFYTIIANGIPRKIIPAKITVLKRLDETHILAQLTEQTGQVKIGFQASIFLLPRAAKKESLLSDEDSSSSMKPLASNPDQKKTQDQDSVDSSVVAATETQSTPESAPPAQPKEIRTKETLIERNVNDILRSMVYVSGGLTIIGLDQDVSKFWNETPAHPVVLEPFFIDRHEVSREDYACFIQVTGHPPPHDWGGNNPPEGTEYLPVVNVSWSDARAFAKWAKKRLPTEMEWEAAGRGKGGLLYPWGNTYRRKAVNSKEQNLKAPQPPGSFKMDRSPYGVMDLAGNVSEWTGSHYRPYPDNAHHEPEYDRNLRVVRGGAYSVEGVFCRLVFRASLSDDYKAADLGFRCAISKKELEAIQEQNREKKKDD